MTIQEIEERIEDLKEKLKDTAEEFILNNNLFVDKFKPTIKEEDHKEFLDKILDRYLKAINTMEDIIIANNLILAMIKKKEEEK